MAYSTAFSQAISILLFIHVKTKDNHYDFLSTKVISETLDIPFPTAVKVIKGLNVAGITNAKEGSKGGVLLTRPLSEITLLEVFMAIEQGKPLFKEQPGYRICGDYIAQLNNNIIKSLKCVENSMKDSLQNIKLDNLLEIDN